MPATRSVTSEFSYDAKAARYRRAGKFVSDRAVKLGVARVIRTATKEIAQLAADVSAGKIPVAEWQSAMSGELKSLHVAAAIAGRGGLSQMARADYLRVGRELKFQYAKLRGFAADVAAHRLTARQTTARAALYVAGMNRTFEGTRRATAVAAGFDEERSILGPHVEHSCTGKERPGCVEQAAMGWRPIGSLVPPGSRQCLSSCACSWAFRRRRPIPA